jgi:hypothetical protein
MLLSSVVNVPVNLWYQDQQIEFPVRIIWGILLTNLHTAWVHIVISKPSPKSSWQRIPGWREWIEIIPAASLDIILPPCVYYVVKTLLALARDCFFDASGDEGSISYMYAIFMLPIALAYATSLVTRAVYIRVAASMLPSEDEPLVPFDRSFGGRAGTSQAYSLVLQDAKAGTVQSWNRYRRIVWGVLGYEWLCGVVFAIILSAELYFWAPCTILDLILLAFADVF